MENLEVSKNRIVIEQIEQKVTKTGIILNAAQEQLAKGTVVAIYAGKRDENFINVGDVVFFTIMNTIPIKHEDKEYLLTNEESVFYKIKEKN